MQVDPHTPVIIGVGQFTERLDDPGYRGMSAVDLATEAARAALSDTGVPAADVAAAVEVMVGLRQFEICTPFTDPPLGASDNYVRSVAGRIGADPARAVLEPIGGNGSQKVTTEFAGEIARGDVDVALILGDNLFFGAGMGEMLERAAARKAGATVFAYHVENPQAYGVVTLDRAGRVQVGDDLTLPGHPEVFVVGDMIALDNLPGVAQVAIQGAKYSAKEIRRRLEGKAPQGAFRFWRPPVPSLSSRICKRKRQRA